MRVLVFRHAPDEDLGTIRPALESRGITVQPVDIYTGAAPPPIESGSGLILMGGAMSVNDNLPWLEIEMDLIRAAVERSTPMLGVCLGAQLIAKALGATVRRAAEEEIGWFDIQLTSQAAADPLFAGLSSPLPVFHWHRETFDLPDGANLLASSERCAHQAFRIHENVYGVQFHPEVTPEIIADWSKELPSPIDACRFSPHLAALSDMLIGRWAIFL